ncbi:unnamed protein product [Moneuplotes crassus]|uniref:Uncharacterized protein n=1 Tax=Euplotes crassus TaxID=5936 RepID=A0AAD1XKJ4_EUPCR|nr:unnamed protein product [Moneuplotes crassus]
MEKYEEIDCGVTQKHYYSRVLPDQSPLQGKQFKSLQLDQNHLEGSSNDGDQEAGQYLNQFVGEIFKKAILNFEVSSETSYDRNHSNNSELQKSVSRNNAQKKLLPSSAVNSQKQERVCSQAQTCGAMEIEKLENYSQHVKNNSRNLINKYFLPQCKTTDGRLQDAEFQSIFSVLEEKKPRKTSENKKANFILESNGADQNNENSQRVQHEIDQINKEFQEDSEYQELKNEEIDAELEAEEEEEENLDSSKISKASKDHKNSSLDKNSTPLESQNQSIPLKDAGFEETLHKSKPKQEEIITISNSYDDEEVVPLLSTQPPKLQAQDADPNAAIETKSYTNIQTETQMDFYKHDGKKSSGKKRRLKKKSKVFRSNKKTNIQRLHYGNNKLNMMAMKNISEKRPEIYIKDNNHQRQIEARLEKGIVPVDEYSIYSTGLGLQNKLIDEEKLAQMVNSDPTQESYQEMIKKLKDNPKLLLDIIPSSNKAANTKLRERFKKSQEMSKNQYLINQKVLGAKIRPGTTGASMRVANYTNENRDLIESFDQPESIGSTHYSQKNHPIHPRLDSSIRKLTREQILKLSDTELTKYMSRIAKARNKQNFYWPIVHKNIETPAMFSRLSHKGRKGKVKGQATKLANDLFSYYTHKGKPSSFTLHKSQNNEGSNRKMSINSDPIKVHQREYRREDSDTKSRILGERDGSSHNNNDYNSEYTNLSTDNYKYKIKGSLPSLPESSGTKKYNKSVPRLSQLGFPIAGRMKYRKRKLNINKISSNLHKKDIIPRFKEGVIQQMDKRRHNNTLLRSYYQNTGDKSTAFRNVKTASGKRNHRISQYNTNNSNEEIKEVREEDQVIDTDERKEQATEEEKLEAMKKMVENAFKDHLQSQTHLIAYPNEYTEWSTHELYQDITNNQLKEFNHEKSFKILSEKEVDYVLEMMETRKKDFTKSDMIKPFYLKAHLTYKTLGKSIGISDTKVSSDLEEFKTINILTTIRLLKKLKRLFYNRAVIIGILYDIKLRDLYSKMMNSKIKDLLACPGTNTITQEVVNSLNEKIPALYETDYKITSGIRNLYGISSDAGSTLKCQPNEGENTIFKFNNLDYGSFASEETNSLSNIIQMLQIIAMAQD